MSTGIASAQTGWELVLTHSTGGSLRYQGQEIADLGPGYFLSEWRGGGISGFDYTKLGGPTLVGVTKQGGVHFTSELTPQTLNDRTMLLSYKLTAHVPAKLNSLHVSLVFPASVVKGQTFQVDDQPAVAFPPALKGTGLSSGKVSALVIGTAQGPLSFRFRQPTSVLVQDNRQWSDNFTVRINAGTPMDTAWPAGQSFSFDLELGCPAPCTLRKPEVVTLAAGDEWIPLDTVLGVKEGSALDFSKLGFCDAPAGKHGWVKAVGKHFEFEGLPGQPQRFYGVNFVSSGQVNPPEQSTELAERLLRLGYNTVRFHHHENSLIKRADGVSTTLNPEAMDQFDFFFNELKQRGLYSTTDLYVSRQVYASEIWPGAEGNVEMNEYKMLLPVNRAAMDNWKTWTRNFLTHRNPYTGLTYGEDPAMAWICMVNEGTLSNSVYNVSGRLKEPWVAAWNAWLQRKYQAAAARNRAWGADRPAELADLLPREGATPAELKDFALFLQDTEDRMFAEMRDFVRRDCGSRALLSDMNNGGSGAWAQLSRTRFDYVDHHFYVDHPSFLDQRWRLPSRCPNESVVRQGNPGGTSSAFLRLFDKPFTITEYNYSGPGRYRGVGGILTGCLGALQDWAGIWRFAYAHGNSAEFTPGVTNYFDMVRDPLNQAAERATLCLYLRGDMAPAEKSIALTMTPDHLVQHPAAPETSLVPEWRDLVTLAQVGTFVGERGAQVPADVSLGLTDTAPRAAKHHGGQVLGEEGRAALAQQIQDDRWLGARNRTDLTQRPAVRQSLNNQLTLDPAADTMILDTAGTAGGFAPAGTTIDTRALRIVIRDTDATVWASSLDGQPIATSRHLLVTHLTDLQNTGTRFAEQERKTLLDWGKLPHLVRNGRASVLLRRTGGAAAQAWVLRTDGERLAELPLQATGEGLALELSVKGAQGAQMIYEVVIE